MDPTPSSPPDVLPTAPLAPPTVPGALSVHRRTPVWPTPLGVVYIVVGFFGGMMGLVQVLTQQVSLDVIKGFPAAHAAVVGMERYRWENLAMQCLSVVCGVMLVIAGIFILLKRRRVVPLVFTWAILKILTGIGVAILAAAMQKIQIEATMAEIAKQKGNSGGPPPGMMAAVSNATMGFTILFAVLWAAALPVFSIIWFRLAGVRETVASWRR